ncbi:site-specific integrase [Fodinicurvata sp. EGI_FJ10296]|uniref:site-specific integrase n=1 Tax=Fodinicurvata sp. EGI_FJ10296 TaxID=3231908 RepID=UPI00345428B3
MTKTLNDLDILTTLLPTHLTKTDIHAARKAITRAHAVADKALTDIPACELEALHARAVGASDLGWKTLDGERRAMRKLQSLPMAPAALTAAVAANTATLADASVAVDLQTQAPDRKIRIRGALTRFADVLNSELAEIPAVERRIRTSFDGLTAIDFGVRQQSFDNIKSMLLGAVRLVDRHGHRRLSADFLVGPWRRLVDGLPDGQARAKLWRLVSYCYERDIQPDAVDDSTVDALEADLAARKIKGAHETVRAIVYAWEELQKSCEGFPRQSLARRYRTGVDRWNLRFDDLSAPFKQSWYAFVERMTAPGAEDFDPASVFDDFDDLIAGVEHAPNRQYAPGTLRSWKTAIAYAALADQAPSKLRDIAQVLTPEHAVGALKHARDRQSRRAERQDGKPSEQRSAQRRNIVSALLTVAKIHDVDDASLEKLRRLLWRVHPHIRSEQKQSDGMVKPVWQSGSAMGSRHRDRLRKFADPAYLEAWRKAPAALLRPAHAAAAAGREPDQQSLLDAMVGLLHLILRSAPLRRANLCQLRFRGPDQNVKLPSGEGKATLWLAAEEVKNHEPLTVELTEKATTELRFWLRHLRPVLASRVGASAENPFVFPAKGAKHRALELMNMNFVDRNRRLGFELNLHASRHLAAKIALDAGVDCAVIQKLLGHKRLETTLRYYAEIASLTAQRQYQSALLQRYAAEDERNKK